MVVEPEAFTELEGIFSTSLQTPVQTFVVNSALQSEIRRLLQRRDSTRPYEPRILIVWGIGGCGKTQSILNYACEFESEYKAVFWLNATSKSTLDHDFIALYRELSSRSRGKPVTLEHALSFVKSYFSRMPGPWLMVLDADNGTANEDYDKLCYIPQVSTVDVIITSRSCKSTNRWTLGKFPGCRKKRP